MLNKYASKYLEKKANPMFGYDPMMSNANLNMGISPEQYQKQKETAIDVVINIPKGVGDYVLNTADYTLKPAGILGYKLSNRFWAPFYSIPGLWNGQGFINTRNNLIKHWDKQVDKDYNGVSDMIEKDKQAWDTAIPTTTEAGKFTRNTAEIATSAAVGTAIGNTNFAPAVAASSIGQKKLIGSLLSGGVKLFDLFGPDTFFEQGVIAGEKFLR